MKNIRIKITGNQDVDGVTDSVQFIGDGTFLKTDNGFLIKYTEGELAGKEKTETEIEKISEKGILLKRKGGINSELRIVEGERNTCFYATDIGGFTVGIYGEKVSCEFSSDKGEINLRYNLDSNMQPISKNEVKISVRELKGK